MSIRSIIEEQLGYVTEEDRRSLRAFEEKCKAEKQKHQNSIVNNVVTTGVNSAVALGDMMVQSKLTGENTAQANSKRATKKIITTRTEQTVQDAYDLGYY